MNQLSVLSPSLRFGVKNPSSATPAQAPRFGQDDADRFSPAARSQQRDALRQQVRDAFGIPFVPNVLENMIQAAPVTANIYLNGQLAMMQQATLSPVERDVVQMVASQDNGCTYCTTAHGFSLAGQGNAAAMQQIQSGQAVSNKRLNTLVKLTQDLMKTQGKLSARQKQAYHDQGFSEEHMVEIIGLIGLKAISNYTNRLLGTPLDPWMQAGQ